MLVQQLYSDEEVGFVGMFCWKGLNVREGWAHLSGKGAAVFADVLSAAVNSGMGSISNIFGCNTLFKLKAQESYLEMPQAGQETTSTHKLVTKCPENIYEAGYKCVCLNARSIVNKI